MTRSTVALAAALAAGLLACARSAYPPGGPTGSSRSDDRVRPAPSPRDDDRNRPPAATSRHPFEVEGTVTGVGQGVLGLGGRSLTIARKDAPAATLEVAEETRITLDDRPARLTDLREGDQVKAVFDFDRNSAVAIEVQAKAKR